MKSWIIGITCLSLLVIFCPVTTATPVGSSSAFRPNKDQHAEFGEGIRDWFRNVKNRIFGGRGGDQQALPPPEAGKMMMDLENEDLQDRRRNNPGTFFLDLTNLTFDPETDWGFRLGQWYFIRKPYDRMNPNDWLPTSESSDPEWSMSEDDEIIPPVITIKNDNGVPTTLTSTSGGNSPEITEPPVPEIRDEDNETRHYGADDDLSAEVLLPAE